MKSLPRPVTPSSDFTPASLADAAATPYIFRAEAVGMDGLWQKRRPKVALWYDRIRARKSFAPAVTDPISAADRDRFNVPQAPRSCRTIVGDDVTQTDADAFVMITGTRPRVREIPIVILREALGRSNEPTSGERCVRDGKPRVLSLDHDLCLSRVCILC